MEKLPWSTPSFSLDYPSLGLLYTIVILEFPFVFPRVIPFPKTCYLCHCFSRAHPPVVPQEKWGLVNFLLHARKISLIVPHI